MKSYVSMEQHICPICGVTHDTGSVLLDKKLSKTMEMHTITGSSLCPKHQKLSEEGYIALVVIDPDKSDISDDKLKPENAYRTGEIIHIKREILSRIMDMPPKYDNSFIYAEPDVIRLLNSMMVDAPKTIN